MTREVSETTDLRRESVLFSAADRQLEGVLSPREFSRSLMLGILFQPHLLVPDVYFFISSWLRDGLRRQKSITHFEVALQQGVIVPSFRSNQCETFTESLRDIRSRGIQGLLPLPDCEWIAERLDFVTQAATGYRCVRWPDHSVGERYQDLLVNCLATEVPAGATSDTSEDEAVRLRWRLSEEWRTVCIQEAIDRSDGGLRRGEVMNALGRRVGINSPVDDMRLILVRARQMLDPQRYYSMQDVCRLVADCYLYNQATQNSCSMDFPRFDALAKTVVLTAGSGFDSEPPELPATIVQRVPFPSLRALRESDPRKLLDIRNNQYVDYWIALKRWQANPTQPNEVQVREYMEAYAAELRTIVDSGKITQELLAVQRAGRQQNIEESVDTAINIGSLLVPGIGLLSSWKWGRTAYRYLARPRGETDVTLISHDEVSLPTGQAAP